MSVRTVMWRVAALGTVLCAGAGSAWGASGGLVLTGTSAKDRGMGGAGMAIARDAVAAINNPAATVVVGDQLTIGLTILYQAADLEVSGAGAGPFPLEPGRSDNKERFFEVPFASATHRIDERWAVGISAYGLFGLGVAFPGHPRSNCPFGMPSGPLCGGESTLDTSALFVTPTIAYRLSPALSVGVSPALVYSRFKAKGFTALAPASVDPANIGDNGIDEAFGYAAKIGIHYEGEDVAIGLTYQTEANMERYERYGGLLPEGGNFDLPAILALGIAYDPVADVTLAADVQGVFYADVPVLGNRFVNPLVPGNPMLGSDGGAGFGWKDQWILHLGAEHRVSESLALRAGYAYATKLYGGRDALLNAMAPAIMRHNVAAGFSQALFDDVTLDVGITYALPLSQDGFNPLSPDQRISSTHGIVEGAVAINYAW
ncbi:outer membrane protein transport protein [Zavarzinia compransoris]|uniref:OmpP1/FadL family transporter n=1 Tax=Zavarzinia marina TaxID=2911065 RepID=UPI001F1C3F81|nr:outer membrane protein transport protein [Zavarzinia marina]MCF4167303.1 outer membrane protein transport protein [Zavarzinia marina]